VTKIVLLKIIIDVYFFRSNATRIQFAEFPVGVAGFLPATMSIQKICSVKFFAVLLNTQRNSLPIRAQRRRSQPAFIMIMIMKLVSVPIRAKAKNAQEREGIGRASRERGKFHIKSGIFFLSHGYLLLQVDLSGSGPPRRGGADSDSEGYKLES
jgi:hypothetical protein